MRLLSRRYFLGATGAVAIQARVRRKILIVLVDGMGPEYVHGSDLPNIQSMIRSGVYVEGQDVMPSVTNVNNASLVTGAYPKDHGITTNYYYDRATGQAVEMESAEFLLRPTVFEKARKAGMRTALVSAKDKVRTLVSRGADVAVSGERPAPEFLGRVGPRAEMYSAEVNYWCLRAARLLLREVDLLYLSTTDYMMHTYPPSDQRSREHMHQLDALLGEMLNDHAGLEVYITADHGMSAKREAVDLKRFLAEKGVAAEVIPIIRDRHVVHHGNLGGSCYVYLKDAKQSVAARELLASAAGVEEVYSNSEAAERFQLHPDRIGDFFVLGAKDIAFGDLDHVREPTKVRTHGSRYESTVPILCYGRKVDASSYRVNLDIVRNLSL